MKTQEKLLFTHRSNPDGTIDSICRSCFITVARAFWEADLERDEHCHVCDPVDLARFHPDIGGAE